MRRERQGIAAAGPVSIEGPGEIGMKNFFLILIIYLRKHRSTEISVLKYWYPDFGKISKWGLHGNIIVPEARCVIRRLWWYGKVKDSTFFV